ncbi:acyltransferase, partial [Escherichia coli]|nr:acyltransferase [Escherichia coli]
FATVPVVLGTILLLQGEVRETAVGRLLAMRPLVLTGLMSYSLYLWHQPLFAFYRLHRGGEISTAAGWILIVLVFPIAYLSWQFVEGPARRPDGPLAARTALLLFLAESIGSSMVVAHRIKVERGLPQRIPASVIRVLDT